MNDFNRCRRLRYDERLRKMTRETRVDASSLIYPMFIIEGNNKIEDIPSMYGQCRYTVDMMGKKFEELLDAGVDKVMLFGIPQEKDERGSGAYAEDGIIQKAMYEAKKKLSPDVSYRRCMHVRVYFTRTLRNSL